ncbi:MAG: hypothetical protein V2A73_05630 [Pseudomonadota bacterium]
MRTEDSVSVSVDLEAVRPSQTFAADLCLAQTRHGRPEILFIQTHPLRPLKVERILAVRYAVDQFIARPQFNESFLQLLEADLATAEPGWDSASPGPLEENENAAVITMDADFEVLVRTAGFSAFIPVAVPAMSRHAVVAGKTDELLVQPLVEITMPPAVLALLLKAWRGLARDMTGGRS